MVPVLVLVASTGSPKSPLVLTGSEPLSTQETAPLVDCEKPVYMPLPDCPESLKAQTTFAPVPNVRVVSLWVSLEVASLVGLLTNGLGTGENDEGAKAMAPLDDSSPEPVGFCFGPRAGFLPNFISARVRAAPES